MKIATDFDGTISAYSQAPGAPLELNMSLLLSWVQLGVTGIAIVTNQGGVSLGFRDEDEGNVSRFRSPAEFARLINETARVLVTLGIDLYCVSVATFHPKVSSEYCHLAAGTLAQLVNLNIYLHASGAWDWRKPSPLMLLNLPTKAAMFYGDGDEDEQAAMLAGMPFSKVDRFYGAGTKGAA